MTKFFADLHTHTLASDGTNRPSANVRMAKEAGLSAVAITDHDTVSGVVEAIAEGERLGIHVVPGVEISTVAKEQDIHVLGFYIDIKDKRFNERLLDLRNVREQRNEMMVAKLRELGIAITMDDVMANQTQKQKPDETIGRPHIAEFLMNKGIVSSMEEAFHRYLGKTGSAYVNPPRIAPQEAIYWIHEAGGTAVLAHPGLYNDDALVTEIIVHGLDGIEAYHSDHSSEDAKRYVALAKQHGLLVTAGSDYHGERNGVIFHASIGSQKISTDVLDSLNKRSTNR